MTASRVCLKEYKKGFSNNIKDGFYMETELKDQLDILLKNVTNDWDFTILITGGGEVRIGKSVLAMQIAAYWIAELKRLYNIKTRYTLEDNFVFDGRKLIEKGNFLGQNYPFSPLIYDEAGADLEGRKVLSAITQDVLDYYRECGQYNMLNIIVLPEFFDLPKGVALSRSICLIDVYMLPSKEGIFQRGFYNFYSKPNKKWLYLKGKRDLDYKAFHYDFRGRFYNFYSVDEDEYRQLKQDALTKRESKRRNKFQMQRDACWFLFYKDIGWTQDKIAKRMEQLTGIFVARETVRDGLAHYSM